MLSRLRRFFNKRYEKKLAREYNRTVGRKTLSEQERRAIQRWYWERRDNGGH